MKQLKNSLWRVVEWLPLPAKIWPLIPTLLSHLTRNWITVGYREDLDLYLVKQSLDEIFVARRSRVRLFHRGIRGRVRFVEESYDVPVGAVGPGDIVVDCGANIGEFARAMELRGAVVIAFEPEILEWRALEKNLINRDSRAINLPLWSSSGEVLLRHANNSGDSSVQISGEEDGQTSIVQSVSFDDWAEGNLLPDQIIKLFKLEAEGSELDVLIGFEASLRRIQYICADLGEATRTSATAVPEVTNFLLNRGFEVATFSTKRCMTVYQNTHLVNQGSSTD